MIYGICRHVSYTGEDIGLDGVQAATQHERASSTLNTAGDGGNVLIAQNIFNHG
jgi:hypothetical protein